MYRKVITIFFGLVLIISVLFVAGYYYLIRYPLPALDGEIQVKGLQAPVEVFRDQWGIPHIYAENIHDLLMAQGFVQAQDRLWQMEANRRLAAGRLSEILGPETIELDKLLRTFGFIRAARKEATTYDSSSKLLLQAFADGVNSFINMRNGRLPLEFKLLGVKPEPWLPEHSIAWAKVMALSGGKNWQEEIVRALLTKKLGDDKATDLLSRIQQDTAPIIPPGLNLTGFFPLSRLQSKAVIPDLGGASNNWVVNGSRTVTGSPLLANDMHLPLNIPSIWYETHLTGGGLDVLGLSLIGVPLIIAGHNQDIAWGITFAYTDVQDIYLERFNPENEGKYLFKDSWLKAELIDERIKVKGMEESVLQRIRVTRHGPVISPHVPKAKGVEHAIAFKWSSHDPGNMLNALYSLNMARNWESFKKAVQQWTEPAINLVYADREGNIGYALGSRIPIRAGGHGRGPFPGWTGENEWTGYLEPDRKPFILNPVKGFVATANNRVVGPGYPVYLADDYAQAYRAARINEVLFEKNPVSKSDFRDLQGDQKCLPADGFIKSLEGLQMRNEEAKALLKLLRDWDRVLDKDSTGGAVYAVFFYRLMENTFQDELGPIAERFFGIGLTYIEPLNRFVEHSRAILISLMSEPDSSWFDDTRTLKKENFADMVERSLIETSDFLKKKLGPEPHRWRWGKLHKIIIPHPLGSKKPLDRIFNLGPYEGGGHFSTVLQSAVKPGMDFSLNGWTVSHRHIYDLKDWDQSLGNIVPGQSGMYGSPHYDDQVELWLNRDHHPLYYSRSKVRSKAKNVLTLYP